MSKEIVSVGEVFGRWRVIARAEDYIHRGKAYRRWLCYCECGNVAVCRQANLRSGGTLSCGCLQREYMRAVKTLHGEGNKSYKSAEYRTWCSMIARCENETSTPHFWRYGGRGIYVCRRWRESYVDFLSDMGRRPAGMSLDRIDNNGSYTCGKCEHCLEVSAPLNCQWANTTQQARNSSRAVYTTVGEVTDCMTGWAERLGMDYRQLKSRRRYRSLEEIVRSRMDAGSGLD